MKFCKLRNFFTAKSVHKCLANNEQYVLQKLFTTAKLYWSDTLQCFCLRCDGLLVRDIEAQNILILDLPGMKSPADSSSLRSISIYESRTLILVSGLSLNTNGYFLLRINRTPASAGQKQVLADRKQYSKEEVNSVVTETKCVSIIEDACCIFGFIKLVESIYIVVITKAVCVANIHGHDIYTVRETNLVPITYKARNTMDESRYKSILQNLNLAYNDFYFSYTYDIAKSMQRSKISKSNSYSFYSESLETRFIWNYYAIQQFLNCIAEERLVISHIGEATSASKEAKTESPLQRWLIPLIHGFLKQSTICLALDCSFKYTLISRRSRIFAGTRYLRRGVDSNGFSANEVETEQIVTRVGRKEVGVGVGERGGGSSSCRSCSLTQIRGSVPLYWYQTNLFVPSPDIKIDDIDHGYDAGLNHFNLLKGFYGNNLTVLNLVRSQNSEREIILGTAYEDFIIALNKYYEDEMEGKGLNGKKVNDDVHILSDQDDGSSKDTNEANVNVNALSRRTLIDYVAFDFHSAPHNTLFSQLDGICEKIFPASGFYLQSKSMSEDNFNSSSSSSNSNNSISSSSNVSGVTGHNETDSQSSSSSPSSWLAESDVEAFLTHRISTTPSKEESYSSVQPLPLPLLPSHVNNGHTYESSETDENDKKVKEEKNEIGSGIRSGFLQRGVLRTNCVDCLDRTNVAQFCYARLSLMYQFKALGADVHPTHMQRIDALCSDIWSEHGDAIANQYGGSGAMHSVSATSSTSITTSATTSYSDVPNGMTSTISSWDFFTALGLGPSLPTPVPTPIPVPGTVQASLEGENESEFVLSGGAKNALVAVQRYYSNVAADFDRQQSIDLLLGVHVPQRGCPSIWDVDMYTPTVSRGIGRGNGHVLDRTSSNTSTLPLASTTVDAGAGVGAGNGSSVMLATALEDSSALPDSNPPSCKSFTTRQTDHSNLPNNTHCPHKISLLFPSRDIDRAPPRCVSTMSNGVQVQVLPHDLIALGNLSCRAYPPGTAVAPAASGTQALHPSSRQHVDGKADLNHDDGGPNGNSYHTVPFGHLQAIDNDISHTTANMNERKRDPTYPEGPIQPMSGTEDKDTYGTATVSLESIDPESIPAATSYFSWLF